MPTYAIQYDPATGYGYGVHVYHDTNVAVATNEMVCTEVEAQTPAMYQVVNGALVERLDAAQTAKVADLSSKCRAQIEAGFDSDALGATHHYPAQQQDQANLTASVTSSLLPNLPTTWTTPFWCRDSAGNWNYTDHTAAQIQQAGQDGKAAITAALRKNGQLARQVQAIGTEPGWSAGASIAGSDIIQAGGRRYQASSAGGTTGSTEPVWPSTTGEAVTDGTVTWTDLGTLLDGVYAIVW